MKIDYLPARLRSPMGKTMMIDYYRGVARLLNENLNENGSELGLGHERKIEMCSTACSCSIKRTGFQLWKEKNRLRLVTIVRVYTCILLRAHLIPNDWNDFGGTKDFSVHFFNEYVLRR